MKLPFLAKMRYAVGMKHTTVYEALLERGYTEAQIREACADDLGSTRTVVPALMDTPDGMPVVGVSYRCDYRAEEEWGIGTLRQALAVDELTGAMSPKKTAHVTQFSDVRGSLVVSVKPIEPLPRWGLNLREEGTSDPQWRRINTDYKAHWDTSLGYTQGIDSRWKLERDTVPLLKKRAEDLGISLKGITKKSVIIDTIMTSEVFLSKATTPNQWPGDFHYGDVLVLRADKGIVSDILELLFEAATRGSLGMSGGHAVFSSGIGFYDGADIGPKLIAERKEQSRWNKAQMKLLEPVEKTLKERGIKWYFLGNPRNQNGVVRYWLNGHSMDVGGGLRKQPFGWYTAQELLDEKFKADARKGE